MSHPVPREVSLDNLLGIIQGWYAAGAGEEACTNADVVERTGYANSTISRQNQFLISLSVLEKDGKKKRLTDAGEAYAESLRYQRDESNQLLADLLFDYPVTDSIVDFVSIQRPEKEAVIEQLYEITEQDSESNASVKTLYDLYLEAGIFIEGDEGLDAISEREFDTDKVTSEQSLSDGGDQSLDREKDEDSKDQSQVTTEIVSKPSSNIRYSVEINLEISGDDEPENVYQLVSSVRRSLEKPLSELSNCESDSSGKEGENQAGLTDFE